MDAPSTITLRRATEADVDAIARVWQQGWLDAHVEHVPQELVAHRGFDQFVRRGRDRVPSTWVATLGGAVVGFVTLKDDELEQIFVERAARGSGVAVALLARGEEELRAAGHRTAWLAVVSGNARARAFYERQGWRDAGGFVYHAETAAGPLPVPSQRYERDLVAGA